MTLMLNDFTDKGAIQFKGGVYKLATGQVDWL